MLPIFKNKRQSTITILLVIYDIVTILVSGFLALLIRFDFEYSQINPIYIESFKSFIIYYALICVIVYSIFKLYRFVWRFVSYNEMLRTTYAIAVSAFIEIVGTILFIRRMPISYYMISIIFQYIFAITIRFSYRFYLLLKTNRDKNIAKVMLIGAGSAGRMILNDVNRNHHNEKIVCIIDDNVNKQNRLIDNVEIVGGRESIVKNVKKYGISKILIAIPNSSSKDTKDIINICKDTDCEIMIIPSLYKFSTQNLTVDALRNIDIEDLLGRDPVEIDMDGVFNFIKGKTILVTGGGGSIGSEICRQVASHSPKQLIIFDVYENNAYDIQMELRREYPQMNLVTLIGSVRDTDKVMKLFEEYKPDIVYHAAAHKHVPLMEDSPCEAIKNNVLGTYNVAFAALLNNTSRFVLISTDKAVNPRNIMGASKRICEMIIQTFSYLIKENKADLLASFYDKKYTIPSNVNTNYAAVRFGNVLGSNGSVVPLFKKQIEQGGPVTVTSPEMTRFFMSIPEAVRLVMQASVFANGGEIFVLDMGEPVKIETLARNLISLAGYKPDKDIKIVYIGLRPGEKMYEERLMAEEGLQTTENKAISIGKPIDFDHMTFVSDVRSLINNAYKNDRKEIDALIKKMVPTYEESK